MKNYRWPQLTDYVLSIVFAITLYIIHKLVDDKLYGFFRENLKEKKSEEIDHIKAKKAAFYIFKGCFMTCLASFGWYILHNKEYTPTWLFGVHPEADLKNIWNNYPVQDIDFSQRVYWMGTFSYHVMKTYIDVAEVT